VWGDWNAVPKIIDGWQLQHFKKPQSSDYHEKRGLPFGDAMRAVSHSTDDGLHEEEMTNEPQIVMTYKSPSLVDTDVSNVSQFGCWLQGETTPVALNKHPFLEFDQPLGRVHVHLENPATGDVKWDAVYNLENTNKLKPNATPISGARPNMFTMCPPRDETYKVDGLTAGQQTPPTAYQLDVWREGNGFVPRSRDEMYIGGATMHMFLPQHDPSGFGMPFLK
jgi:hypothetical protein